MLKKRSAHPPAPRGSNPSPRSLARATRQQERRGGDAREQDQDAPHCPGGRSRAARVLPGLTLLNTEGAPATPARAHRGRERSAQETGGGWMACSLNARTSDGGSPSADDWCRDERVCRRDAGVGRHLPFISVEASSRAHRTRPPSPPRALPRSWPPSAHQSKRGPGGRRNSGRGAAGAQPGGAGHQESVPHKGQPVPL
jgi:hypothetical protein